MSTLKIFVSHFFKEISKKKIILKDSCGIPWTAVAPLCRFKDGAAGSKHHGRPGRPRHRGAVRAERRLPVLRRPGGQDQSSQLQLRPHDSHESSLHPPQELPGEDSSGGITMTITG